MNLSVIIPSKTALNLTVCLQAMRLHEPAAHVLVVDDGIDWGAVCLPSLNVHVMSGDAPFVFSRNVNIGIEAAYPNDILVLNDDAVLQTPGGFSLLQRAAQEHPEIGIIGCTTNVTGARCQIPHNVGLRVVENFAFVGVLIPRRTINTVGLLDERFGGIRNGIPVYGWEDQDYVHRVKLAGLKCAVHDGCFVDHGSLKSTFRQNNGAGNIGPGREIYAEKWGTCEV